MEYSKYAGMILKRIILYHD